MLWYMVYMTNMMVRVNPAASSCLSSSKKSVSSVTTSKLDMEYFLEWSHNSIKYWAVPKLLFQMLKIALAQAVKADSKTFWTVFSHFLSVESIRDQQLYRENATKSVFLKVNQEEINSILTVNVKLDLILKLEYFYKIKWVVSYRGLSPEGRWLKDSLPCCWHKCVGHMIPNNATYPDFHIQNRFVSLLRKCHRIDAILR